MRSDRPFIVFTLVPAFFFLVMFYAYPAAFNLLNSFTDLSLFGFRQGGAWIGLDNYLELVTSPDFHRVLWNTVFWLTLVAVGARIVLGLLLALLLNSEVLAKYRLRTVSRVLLLALAARPAPWRDQSAAAVARPSRRAGRVPVRGALDLAGADNDHHLEHPAARHPDLPGQPAVAAEGADRGGRGRWRQ
jgi:hypothetical protein